MKRRSFLKSVSGAMGGTALSVSSGAGADQAAVLERESTVAGMPRRVLGRTGLKISVVAFPGLALNREEQEKCNAAIHSAFEKGVNYYDVAPAYGESEIKMGIGLQGLNRGDYYLACKTKKRDAAGAQEELERSLERLKTDYFDVYQMHCLIQPDEVEQAFGTGGAIETLVKAKEEGKVRNLGFSAHTTKAALAAMKRFAFDTVMFPINFVEYFKLGYGKPILELAEKQGTAVLAIKAMSRGRWPEGVERTRKWWYRSVENETEVSLALRFTLSRPGVVAGFPPAFVDLLDKAIVAARSYEPLSDDETEQLRDLAGECYSVFQREEQKVAFTTPQGEEPYPDSPHSCCMGEVT